MSLNKTGVQGSITSLSDMLKVNEERLRDAQQRLAIAEQDVTFYQKTRAFLRSELDAHIQYRDQLLAEEENG